MRNLSTKWDEQADAGQSERMPEQRQDSSLGGVGRMKCPKCNKDVIFEETKPRGPLVCPACHAKMTEKEARGEKN